MKVEINIPESQKEEIKFPCLMKAKNDHAQILLVIGLSSDKNYLKGTKITHKPGEFYELGYYSET